MIDILTTQMMRDSDNATINGNENTSKELMYKAAYGVYSSVLWQGRVGIAVGRGNNGGDGYALALILKEKGIESEIISVFDKPKESTTAYYYYLKCIENEIKINNFNGSFDYDIIVDCIFGTGFSGEIDSYTKEIFNAFNNSQAYKVSVDINSGLNGDTGMGDNIIKSDITVSIGSYKLGHFLNMAKDYIGSLTNCDIGITTTNKIATLFEKEDAQALLENRKNYSYKGTYGTVTLIGGMLEYSGAIKLANLSASAVRSGTGVVRLATPKSISCAVAPFLLESTLYPLSEENGIIKYNKEEIDFIIKNSTSIAYGMGTNKNSEGVKIIEHILKEFEGVLVLDAGGIRCLEDVSRETLKNKRARLIVTPHLGEIKAILKDYRQPLDIIPYAKENGITVLLKGPSTMVTNGDNTYIIKRGCPGMATGGSGDVLTGIITALLGYIQRDITGITALGAYINGYAGELSQKELCDISMSAGDTARNVGIAISEIIK